MRGPQNRVSWRVPIGAVLVMTLALAGCKGSDTQAATGGSATAVTTPDSVGTVTGGTEPGTTDAPVPATPEETTVLPWPKITTTIASASANQPAPSAPPTTAAPAAAPPTTPKPAAPPPTQKPVTPACGALTVFNLMYFSMSAADWKNASEAKKKEAIIALDDTAISVQKAIPDLAGAIKTLHDFQLDRIDGKDPETTGLDEASQNVSAWAKANAC